MYGVRSHKIILLAYCACQTCVLTNVASLMYYGTYVRYLILRTSLSFVCRKIGPDCSAVLWFLSLFSPTDVLYYSTYCSGFGQTAVKIDGACAFPPLMTRGRVSQSVSLSLSLGK